MGLPRIGALALMLSTVGSATKVAAQPPAARAPTALRRAAAVAPTDEVPAPAADQSATTFEDRLRAATPLADLQTLLIPPAGGCAGGAPARESIERARCEASRAFLRRTFSEQTFWAFDDWPQVLRVSGFDPALRGYHVSVAGCLACEPPLPTSERGQPRFVTLAVPEPDLDQRSQVSQVGPEHPGGEERGEPREPRESLRDAVEIHRSTVAFATETEARAWWRQADGNLRVQLLFQPTLTEWTRAAGHGYAMKLLGFRVFNRCTREVLVSRPPSTGMVDSALPAACLASARASDSTAAAAPVEPPPTTLSAREVSTAMSEIRPQVSECFERFKVPGRAQLEYTVLGDGKVADVRLSDAFAGTPTGGCVLEAARKAHFPAFSGARQRFSYPFFLRH